MCQPIKVSQASSVLLVTEVEINSDLHAPRRGWSSPVAAPQDGFWDAFWVTSNVECPLNESHGWQKKRPGCQQVARSPVGGQLGCKQEQVTGSLLLPNMVFYSGHKGGTVSQTLNAGSGSHPRSFFLATPPCLSLSVVQAVLNLWQASHLNLLGAGI